MGEIMGLTKVALRASDRETTRHTAPPPGNLHESVAAVGSDSEPATVSHQRALS